ncbi:SDR family NAD(P)-dependent oxidoreductase [Tsuneonella mangrovi]|uniref:SDR family NAD(P)-dependent oxidoreductase n=1 Tax=Tsuneonella mangrovi TaxID=1982042 RepID=UPI000BA1F363|nr:SDR family NAD(P)-dependent oxidoreductase [Tsuneonella mangrovi]
MAGREFGFENTTDDVLDGIDLTGRSFFITGAYSGLGKETARAIAARGADVILSGRDAEKLAAAAEEISGETGANVETIVCDLGDLASIRACGKEARERFAKIDVLINNAGVMACPLARTKDGFEMQFGTNHLGHFLLTSELMPLIEQGARQRIVNLSSRGHHFDGVHLDDPNFLSREYDKWASYGQSKTANVLFAVGLESRFADKGIHAYAVHPGGIMTNLGRHLEPEDIERLRKRVEDTSSGTGLTFKTIPQGAATTCFAATAPELEGVGGVYLEDVAVAQVDDDDPSGSVRSYAVDPATADALWSLSEELVGTRFAA